MQFKLDFSTPSPYLKILANLIHVITETLCVCVIGDYYVLFFKLLFCLEFHDS